MIRNPKCAKCKKLSKYAKTICLMGRGPKNPDIMIVGEAPGEQEDRQGEAFVGRAGRFLENQLLVPVGINPKRCFIDNAVRCRPPQNRTPSKKEILECRPYLEKVIKAVKPKVIILMGNAALCSALFLDKVSGISRWRGKPLWSREFNCWLMPTYHPSALMRDKREGSWFRYEQTVQDLKHAVQLVGTPPPKFKMPPSRVLSKPGEIISYIDAAMASGMVAVDTETDKFDPRNEILGASLCFKKDGEYFPVYMKWQDIDEPEDVSEKFQELLESKAVRKLFQNIAFDQKFFHFHGYRLEGPADDTMIMAHLLDENFSVGLKQRTWQELSFGGYEMPLERWKLENRFTKNSSYKDIPFEVLAPYAAYDTLATYMLYEKFHVKLKKDELWPLYSKIVMPVRMVMTKAEINGIHLNLDRAAEIKARCEKAKKNLEKQILSLTGKDFNFNSPTQLGHLLFEKMGAPHSGVNRKSQTWKCDKAALTKVANWGKGRRPATKIAQWVLQYKYIAKMQKTYIEAAQTHVWDDERVHSTYRSTGTVTGRVSNADPCTHNIPRDKLIRSLYGPTPGNILVEADIKAAEMRTIALESNDPVLLEIIRTPGADIHNMTYNAMFNKPDDYVPTDDERRVAKAINFGLIYGITAIGLSKRLGISVEQGQFFIDTYFQRFRGVAKWVKDIVKEAREFGYVKSLFKRRRRLTDIRHDDKYLRWAAERQAMNSPIQSAAADYTYIGLIRVDQALTKHHLKAKIIHTVHDCVLIDTPPEEVDMVKKIVNAAFTAEVKVFPIRMDVDIEAVDAWGESGDASKLDAMLTELAA